MRSVSWTRMLCMGAIVIAMTAVAAHADTVISNFEDSTLDGWDTDGARGREPPHRWVKQFIQCWLSPRPG
jgi:hypothetical protein